jgi:hypothetical protein
VKNFRRWPQRSSRPLAVVAALLHIELRILLAASARFLGSFRVGFGHLAMIGLKIEGGLKFIHFRFGLNQPRLSDQGSGGT